MKTYAALAPYFGADGETGYQVVVREVLLDWDTGEELDETEGIGEITRYGPYLGDAILPADVRAARWAHAHHLPYRG